MVDDVYTIRVKRTFSIQSTATCLDTQRGLDVLRSIQVHSTSGSMAKDIGKMLFRMDQGRE